MFRHHSLRVQLPTLLRRNFSGSARRGAYAWQFFDPDTLSPEQPAECHNLVNGKWFTTAEKLDVVDPLTGKAFLKQPATQVDELKPFVDSLQQCSKSGLHNPFKNQQRYLEWGKVSQKMAQVLHEEKAAHAFARAIQRVCPKSYAQAMGEVTVTRTFLENFSGDSVRFLADSSSVPGDHPGQQSQSYRWPYGPVALIAPFNFPLEIPALQVMGALYMGNKVVIKGAETVSAVTELFVRLMLECGAPADSIDVLHSNGAVMNELLRQAPIRLTQFTGSSRVAEQLAKEFHGKIRIEDAGFDWKVLGPDVRNVERVASQCDQDAYAASGQKCSAQSILFMHENWAKSDLLKHMEQRAARRSMDDLTIGPVMTETTESMLGHVDALLRISGARLLWGGKELQNHSIPKKYGAIEPTAVFVPLKEIMRNSENFERCTTEVFGPFQVVTEYKKSEVDTVLKALESMSHHLTAAIVSNDAAFVQRFLGETVNGTTYHGIRARTTGAPANHFFGPCGDPRGAGIGTKEAIRMTWSAPREIIQDVLETDEELPLS